ncbi:molybdopterin molybdotransferase MoeA [Rosenbergiella collisarenosi]|uniref:molybdopterin molybdotransferase MoeA n=1 Tax=Rosenbergiella collisarenosi TaxID=1544695 RepID=UPI001F4FAE98|nr:molybdopterin molybdotransferase MoeA [Rosenbergiella collisarenosi]
MEPFTTDLLSVEAAQELIMSGLTALAGSETISINDALGRVTAEPILSPINVPGFDNSAMDGYALRFADANSDLILPVAGQALAGKSFTGSVPKGQVVQIMTGAPVPAECDTVIMQEQTVVNEQGIRLTAKVSLGQNIRRIGEDVLCGQTVFEAGTRMTVKDLPLLASLGISQLNVKRPLRIAVLSTGDELVSAGTLLAPGQIYDTNRFAITLMLQRLHCVVIDLGIIPDNKDSLRSAFERANQVADLVITTGGVSVGTADYTRDILAECGDITFWKLAMKPGKPFAFGRLNDSLFCGLPGNPVSAVVTFCQLVYPLILRLQGITAPPFSPITATLQTAIRRQPGRSEFQRGNYSFEQGHCQVTADAKQGSHMFSTFSHANCFICIERDRGTILPGESVIVQPFPDFLEGA